MNKLLGLGMFGVMTGAALAFSSAALADNNGGSGGVTRYDAAANSIADSHGQVMCTAAINSDGTVGGGQGVSANIGQTYHVGVGQYQVGFATSSGCRNITAANGFFRWVQVDTLTYGSAAPVSCSTADRYGNAQAVFVQCVNGAGALTDTSFMLFVAR